VAAEWADEADASAVARLGRTLRRVVVPDDLVDGPAPGAWREQRQQLQRRNLFGSVLVVLEGIPGDAAALALARKIAAQEAGQVKGLALVDGAAAGVALEAEFAAAFGAAETPAELAVIEAPIAAEPVLKRMRWADLAVVSVTRPPGDAPADRRSNEFVHLIQHSPRPILAVPAGLSPQYMGLRHALLAYDGSPKAEEALFLAAYVARRWGCRLSVVTVTTAHTPPAALDAARDYLARSGVEAGFTLHEPPIADALLETAAGAGCDWIIMGGFGFRPIRHLVVGSTVDVLLGQSHLPLLICR
jgi:nucleotide-binding universal stress UspA family protein